MALRMHLLLLLQWAGLVIATCNNTSGAVTNHITNVAFKNDSAINEVRQLFYNEVDDHCSENLCGYYIDSDGNMEDMVSNCVYDTRGDRYRSRCTRKSFIHRIRRWENLESCGCCSALLTTRTNEYCNYPSNPPCGGDPACRIPRSRFANSQVCYRDGVSGELESRCVNSFEDFLVGPTDSFTCGACPTERIEGPVDPVDPPSTGLTCGCPSTCTSNILETLATDGVSSISCKTRIEFMMNNFNMAERDACVFIGDRFPDTCGQGCNPLFCSSTGPPPPPPRPAPPTPPTNPIADCGCPNSCTNDVLESLATDGVASIECQTRMVFAMNRFGLTPLNACAMVASRYADACGACDPRTCNNVGQPPPAPAPVPVVSPTGSITAGDLVFAEEFNTGDQPNPNIWTYDLGDWGWGNAEIQRYTNTRENVQVANGKLVITAIRRGSEITSGRIKTLNKFTFKYGRVEASIKVPDLRNGLWPAFWTLGNNFPVIGWPKCGEIDIMEMGNDAPGNPILNQRVGSAAHWFHDPDGRATYGLYLDAGEDLTRGFHTYSMEWTPSMIATFVDGKQIWAMDISTQQCPAEKCSEFHDFHFFLLNLAVGGTYTGGLLNVNQITAPFPARYEIDYVRLYANQWTEVGGPSAGGDSGATPRFDLTNCGCPATCTGQVLDRIAIDSNGGHSCRDRIEWVIANVALTELQACERVSGEFPSVCGQGCNPSIC
ncbi:MAG: hypothetical protein SGBAC_007645 [Bacillariaceae sp.]